MGKKVYLAKYALSSGITEVEVNDKYNNSDEYAFLNGCIGLFYFGKDIFHSKEEAIKKAEEMRIKKIESLKRQIKKLENLKFE